MLSWAVLATHICRGKCVYAFILLFLFVTNNLLERDKTGQKRDTHNINELEEMGQNRAKNGTQAISMS